MIKRVLNLYFCIYNIYFFAMFSFCIVNMINHRLYISYCFIIFYFTIIKVFSGEN
jgi:hypothetical protein